jgi:hypothetical protein
MVDIRVFPFTSKHLLGAGETQNDVDDIDKLRQWVMKYGKHFGHTMGAGAQDDIFVFAWKESPGQWYPVADGIVMSSWRRYDKSWIDITLDAVRIYPNEDLDPIRANGAQRIINMTPAAYARMLAQAYR